MTSKHHPISPEQYVESLQRIARLSRETVREAVRELAPKPGSVGLDLGCGIGLDSLILGEAVGDSGRVLAVDPSPEMLDEARKIAADSEHEQVFEYHQATLDQLPFGENSVDWIWCKDVFWPMPGVAEDPVARLRELCRLVRPGGRIALLYWSSQCLLAGYPRLEATLKLQMVDIFPYLKDLSPEKHFLLAAGWMKQAGLVDLRARSLVTDLRGPMDESIQDSMSCVFDMFFGEMESRIASEEWAQLKRITDRVSPDFLPRREDYFATITHTLFLGTRQD